MSEYITHLPPQSMWIGIGLLAAAAVSVWLAGRFRLGRIDTLSLFSACVLGGFIGGRIAWALLDPALKITHFSTLTLTMLDLRRGGYSSFGAMLGGAAVLGVWGVLSRRAAAHRAGSSVTSDNSQTRATRHTLDVLVLAGLSGLGFARLGCLANGCDFGRVTQVAWALRYLPGTEAYAHHLMSEQIGWGAPWSLGVHPFALYLALGSFGIVLTAATLLSTRTFRPGRIAGWSGIAYLVWRFLAEWTRDPATVLVLWGSFNIHHLLTLIGALACGLLMALEARRHAAHRQFPGGV